MSNNSLVSVILPVFNSEDFLAEAIESILNQTYKNFEFIIINDGSSDASLSIIRHYESIDSRVKVISRENRGLVNSLNEGISAAIGKYIARMDADDISLPTRLFEQVQFLETNPEVGVCGSWVKVFGDSMDESTWSFPLYDDDLKARLLFSVPFAHPSVMIRRYFFAQNLVSYNDQFPAAEDYKLWVDLSSLTNFHVLPKILLRYRYHNSSITRVADNHSFDRAKILLSISRVFLNSLGIKNNILEDRIHHTIELNERMPGSDISLTDVESYCSKIVEGNKKTKTFEPRSLERLLGAKVIVFALYRKEYINLLRYFGQGYVINGVVYLITKKIQQVLL